MKLVELSCPNCGGVLRRKRFSKYVVCDYCKTQFKIEDERAVKREELPKAQIKPKLLLAGILLLFVMKILFVILINFQNAGTVDSESIVREEREISETKIKDLQEPRKVPESPYGKQMASMIFEKPFEEITQENYESIRYLKCDSEFAKSNSGFAKVIYYSKLDYRTSDKKEFEKSIKKFVIQPEDIDGDRDEIGLDFSYYDDWDLTCYKNLSYYSGTIDHIEFLSYMKELTAIYEFRDSLQELTESGIDCEQLLEVGLSSEAMDLQYLNMFNNLQKICFEDRDFDKVPSELTQLSHLESLEFQNGEYITDYSVLNELGGLKELCLYDCDNFKNLDVVNQMPGLEKLVLQRTAILNYDSLKDNQSLKELVLNYNDPVDITPISTIQNLEKFSTTVYSINGVDSLKNLKKLKELELSTNGDTSISFIKDLSELERLTLECCYIRDFTDLYNLSNLKELHINSPVSTLDYSTLLDIPNLEELYLSAGEYDGIWIFDLMKKSSLKVLSVSKAEFHVNLGVDVSQSGLETIILNDVTFCDDDFNEISEEKLFPDLVQLPNLKKLVLIDGKVENIELLGQMKNLEELDLTDNYVTDYSPLVECTNLRKIITTGNINASPEGLSGVLVYKDSGHFSLDN